MGIASRSFLFQTLRRAAERASLAPSVHNTQPWTFVVGPDALEIRADTSRQLPVLDPRNRQLTISCGCALFNARVAIAAAGFEPIVDRFPDPYHPNTLARVFVGEPQDWLPIAELDASMDARRTNRRAFIGEPVSPKVIGQCEAAAQAEGVVLVPITEPEHLAATARLSELADEIEHADPAYLAELREWTTDDPRRRDGVQAATVPYRGTGAIIEPDDLTMRDFDTRGMGWLPSSAGSSSNQCLLLLCSQDDGPAAWLQVGEALERVWLELTHHGYSASPLTQVIEVRTAQEQLREQLAIDLHPELLLRVGQAPDVRVTPRRPHSDVILPSV